MQLLRVRNLARHVHRLNECLHAGLQAPFGLAGVGIEPARHEDLEALLDQVLDQAAARREVPDAKLVDDEQRRAVHLLRLGPVLDQLQQFRATDHSAGCDREVAADVDVRAMFTDIVGATERAAVPGDRVWHDLLESHHALVRRELERFRGREIDTAGDGCLATFDGPARAVRCACVIFPARCARSASGSVPGCTPASVK
ncbi:hypothetical protein QTI66_39120 [Variovorax sp. J22R133]|nr:hypothetical protein [Variovorax sp. J22R133]MDM0118085.1 hypothetical protein [Variovorax sp. J22R133]